MAKGQKMRHEEVNKLIKQGLDQAKPPSTLEPIGLSRKGDNKRLDGLTYTTESSCLMQLLVLGKNRISQIRISQKYPKKSH